MTLSFWGLFGRHSVDLATIHRYSTSFPEVQPCIDRLVGIRYGAVSLVHLRLGQSANHDMMRLRWPTSSCFTLDVQSKVG